MLPWFGRQGAASGRTSHRFSLTSVNRMARKTPDPDLVKLLDSQAATHVVFDRWLSRLLRASRAVERARAKLKRLDRRIRAHRMDGMP